MMAHSSRSRKHEHGFSILETVVAAAIMIIGIGGVMSLFTIAASKNMSQGTQASRCTEYAQDKMEQLMALSFSSTVTDTSSDTTQVPTQPSGGKGLTSGGTTYPSAATTGYVDYVTEGMGSGSAVSATQLSSSAYMRQWSIVPGTDPNILVITVTVRSLQSVDTGAAPITTLVSMKTKF